MNKIFQLQHIQQIGNDLATNRYFYFSQDTAATSKRMAEAFVMNLLPKIRAIQVAGCVNRYLVTREILNGGDDYTVNLGNVPGTAGTAPRLPNQNTMSIAYGVVKFGADAPAKGGKHYSGMGNSHQADGAVTSGILTAIQALLPLIAQVYGTPEGAILVPIVMRVLDSELGTYVVSAILSAVYKKIGTQDSRTDNKAVAESYVPTGTEPQDVWNVGSEGDGFNTEDQIFEDSSLEGRVAEWRLISSFPVGGYVIRGDTGVLASLPA